MALIGQQGLSYTNDLTQLLLASCTQANYIISFISMC